MSRVYWRTIKRGVRKLSDCPEQLHEEIKEIAKQEVIDGAMTVEDYYKYIGENYEA